MLKRVSIQNFKSLKDVTLDLQKVNLLIGPNNSGKTNFLKAIQYLVKRNINQEEENFDLIVFSRLNRKAIKFDVRSIDVSQPDYYISYTCEVERGKPIIKNRRTVSISNNSPYLYNSPPDLYEDIGMGLIYKPDSNKLDKPGPVGRGDDSMAADASNLIAFFDRIRDEYPSTFAQIKADLARCVPEFTEINFQNVESTPELIKEFGDKTFKRIGLTDGRQKTIYWADELSEGTLYFIALLCIINQPNPPKLLLLEEPEKGIHPKRIFEVIQFILRLVEEKDVQVIMTTHSPIVVDMFKDMPESVFIFDKDDEGATHVKNLQRDVIEPEIEKSRELGIEPPHYTDSLGDAWTVGFLGGVPK